MQRDTDPTQKCTESRGIGLGSTIPRFLEDSNTESNRRWSNPVTMILFDYVLINIMNDIVDNGSFGLEVIIVKKNKIIYI